MGEASYGVRLQDGFSGPAGSVVQAMQSIRQGAVGSAQALKQKAGALQSLQGKLAATAGKVREYSTRLQRAKTDLMLLTRAGSGAAPSAITAAKAKVEQLTNALQKQKGTLAATQGAVTSLGRAMQATWSTSVRGIRQNMTASERWMASLKKQGQQMRSAGGRGGGDAAAMGAVPGQSGAVIEGLTGMRMGLIGVAAAAGMMAKRVLDAIGRIVLALGVAIIKGAMFGESMHFSLTKFLGSERKATAEMAKLVQIANELGQPIQDVANTFKDLVSAGYTSDMARDLVKLKADMMAFADSGEQVERINQGFIQVSKAMAAGRFEADGFYSILQGMPGVTKKLVMQNLAKRLGKPFEEMMKIDITKLPVEETIKAMQEVFLQQTKGSKLGEAAMKKSLETFGGAWQALKNIVGNVFVEIGSKIGPELRDTLLPIFKDIMGALKSGEGKAAIAGIVSALKVLIKVAGGFIEGFAAGFKVSMPALKALASAIGGVTGEGDGLAAAFGAIGWVIGATVGIIAQVIGAFVLVGTAVGAAVGAIGDAGAAIADWFSGLWETISTYVSTVVGMASALGSGIIDGIVAGIKAGLSAVVGSISGVVTAGINAAKGALGISSPSKVFANMGQMSAAGYEEGFSKGATGINRAVTGSMGAAVRGGAGGATQNFGGQTANINVSVPGSDDPIETAQAVRRAVRAEVGELFEQMQINVAT